MKLNIANPNRGLQSCYNIDPKQTYKLHNKKIGDTFKTTDLIPELKGYTLQITGGDDKQGFPMKKERKNRKES